MKKQKLRAFGIPVRYFIVNINGYPDELLNHQTTSAILATPQAVTLQTHQIKCLVSFEASSLSGFALICASLVSMRLFIKRNTSNPIRMKPIINHNKKSTFYPSSSLVICFTSNVCKQIEPNRSIDKESVTRNQNLEIAFHFK